MLLAVLALIEPIGFLIGLFFAGMGTIITAVIAEFIGDAILELILPYTPVLKAILLALIVVGPAEELGKYAVLRLITWKNKNFNYSYDAIVYAVFVSLGSATYSRTASEPLFFVCSHQFRDMLLSQYSWATSTARQSMRR